MSDQEMEVEAAPADPAASLAAVLIVITTLMLILATFATYKILGERYNEGILKSK